MPSLQVRDLPEHVYQKLLAAAKSQHRSLAQQAVYILSKGLETDDNPKDRRKKLMSRIRSRGLKMDSAHLENPVDFIREDRNR
ncbi:MAG: FitA-like ribbon-helix-helix domain-containing protein [Thermodesulfobacteriota bacterium]